MIVGVFAGSEWPFPKDTVTCAATQEACSCFRQQIFTKHRAKENVSLYENKVVAKTCGNAVVPLGEGEWCYNLCLTY